MSTNRESRVSGQAIREALDSDGWTAATSPAAPATHQRREPTRPSRPATTTAATAASELTTSAR